MLVVPALLSLKSSILDKCGSEVMDLMRVIIRKLKDPQDIVAKTARKLLLEIYKCYPIQFENNIMTQFRPPGQEEERAICKAVLKNDEEEIQRAINAISVGKATAIGNNSDLMTPSKSGSQNSAAHYGS
jgi:uncharacterized Fe-S radical SAM superfamily protein PflX